MLYASFYLVCICRKEKEKNFLYKLNSALLERLKGNEAIYFVVGGKITSSVETMDSKMCSLPIVSVVGW